MQLKSYDIKLNVLFRDCKFLIDEVGVDQRLLMPATTQLCEALSDSCLHFPSPCPGSGFLRVGHSC